MDLSRRSLFLAFCLLCGCQSRDVELYPVRGKVLFEGQPAAGATVVLRPVTARAPDNVFPRGTVKADGAFEVESYPLGRGAPTGDYVAVLTWFPPDARQQENPVNRLPDRYADEALSGLTVSVKPQSNELGPFELTR